MRRPTRRRLLAASALALGPLAGCAGDGGGDGDGDGDGEGSPTETTPADTTTEPTTTPSATQGDRSVEMTDDLAYVPDRLEVDPGDTVVWKNAGSLSHTVTAYEEDLPGDAEYFASGGFDDEAEARDAYPQGDVASGATFAHTFEVVGTYEYFCVPHEGAGMTGAVQVGSSSTPTTTSTTTTTTTPPPDEGDPTVELTDGLEFTPETLEVEAGTTVHWKNVGSIGHTVTAYEDELPEGAAYFASGGADSEAEARDAYPDRGSVPPGESYEHTFEVAGTFEYFCIPHEGTGMTGTIRVV